MVAFVCHGQTMAMLFQQILSAGDPAVYYENIDNTSVTVIQWGPVTRKAAPERAIHLSPSPGSMAEIQLEQFGATHHLLGPPDADAKLSQGLTGWFQWVGISPRPERKKSSRL